MSNLKRKMVFLIAIIIALMLSPIPMKSQELCGVIPEEGMTFQKAVPYASLQELSSYRPAWTRHIKLSVHIVRYSNGSGGISQSTINTAVQQLNSAYSTAQIAFEIANTYYIDNDTYAYLDNEAERIALMAINVQPATINVYFVPGAAGISGAAYQPGIRLIVVNAYATNGTTFPHEVGHNLFILHTHDETYGKERITRVDIPNCTANCSSAGDLLCDTPADPNLYGNVNANCQWTGSGTDPCGHTNYNPDTRNYMSYAGQCRNQFSSQQIDRMHYMLSTNPTIRPLIQVSVSMANKVGNNTVTGSTLSVNTSTVNSGSDIVLLDGDQYNGKTNHERFSNYAGPQGTGDYKHNEWNGNATEFRLLENFTVDRTTENGRKRDANFKHLNPNQVRSELIETGVTGSFEWKDPWWVDGSGNQPNTFRNITTILNEGVFLNQRIQDGVYYTVRVPQSQPIGGYNANFGVWSGEGATLTNPTNLESPVVFNSTDAVVKANYKLPMKSNLSTAITGNTQRKLVDYDGLWLAYESAGRVWVAKSTDGANSWIPESYIGEGSKPSISAGASGRDITFNKKQADNTYSVFWRRFGVPNTDVVGLGSTTSDVEPNPVVGDICVGYYPNYPTPIPIYNVYFFWNNTNGISYHTKTVIAASHSYESGGTLTKPNSLLRNPSLAMPYLTYDDNTKIYLRKFWSDTATYQSGFGGEEIVPASDREDLGTLNDRESRKSQVTSSGDIVWEVGNYLPFRDDPIDANSFQSLALAPEPGDPPPSPPKSAIFYQKRNSNGTYGAAISWSGSFNFYNPTIASYNGNITVMWETGVNMYRVSSPNLGIGNAVITAGVNPNLASDQLKYAYLTSSAPLFNLNVQPEQAVGPIPLDSCEIVVCEDDPGNVYDVTTSRSGIIWSVSDSTRFEVIIGQPKLFAANGSVARVPFEEIAGSADVTSIDNLVDLLKTKPFKITRDSIRVGGEIIVRNPNGLIIPGTPYGKVKFELVDATTGNVLMRIGNEMTFEQSSKIRFNNKSPVKNLAGRTVYIRPRFVGFPKKNLSGTIVNNYYIKNIVPSSQAISKSNTNEEVKNMPVDFGLSQNHPNPFNPTTQISYALPDPGYITLKIYDVLGREVATLVDEFKDGGYYEATWDATNIPSGVFFYRMQTGSFSETKKLILMR
ncbi:MAG: T9SS type A sorting domain-containing protein [Bacteroidota bacterium]|nr:T9SS type A sorting domain-containing protein [Bacteroidota bacterium]